MSYQSLTDQQSTLLQLIETELRRQHIPVASNQKKGITGRRTIAMGYRRRFNMDFGPSVINTKRPVLWSLLKQFGATLPIQWDSVQLNENATCGRHTDKNNVGLSYIVSVGDYEGGNLIMETGPGEATTEYNCKYKGLVFDGSVPHWNTPHTGTKYSIVYYAIECPAWAKVRQGYPEDWRSDPRYIAAMS